MSRLTISDSTLCIQELVPFVDHLVDGSFEAPSPYLRWWLWVDPSIHILSLQSCLFVLLFRLHLHQQSLVNQHLRWPPLHLCTFCLSKVAYLFCCFVFISTNRVSSTNTLDGHRLVIVIVSPPLLNLILLVLAVIVG
jgi:hypothetical protein